MGVSRILLADDDLEDKAIIQEAMEMLNVVDMLCFADNGEHAWQKLQQMHDEEDHPCLIVLDLNMPKMNGAQALSRMKADQRFKDIPVIIYSTSINTLEKEKCLQLGAHSYITKPVSFNESIETAKTFLAFCHSKTPA